MLILIYKELVMYKNVIFDFYGTLADISTNENKRSLWRNTAQFYCFNGAMYSAAELKRAYLSTVAALYEACPFEHPDVDLAVVFEKLYTDKNIVPSQECVRLTAQTFRILSTNYLKLYNGADELLDSLHDHDKRVYLLTNAQRLFTVPELELLGIYEKFDGIVISSDVKCCKPDKNIFMTLLNEFSLKPEECIMVGNDACADIAGAHAVGIDSVYVKSNLSPDIAPKYSKYAIDTAHLDEILKIV